MSPLTNVVLNLPTAAEFQSIADRLACLHDRDDATIIIQKHVRGHQERNRNWVKLNEAWFEDGQQGRKFGHNIGNGSVEDAIEKMDQEQTITGFTYNENTKTTYFITSSFVDRVERRVVYHEGNPNPPGTTNSKRWKHHVIYLKKPAPQQSIPRKQSARSSPPQQSIRREQPVVRSPVSCRGCNKTFTPSGHGLFPTCGVCIWEGSVCRPLAK